jgi:hypothetical protein
MADGTGLEQPHIHHHRKAHRFGLVLTVVLIAMTVLTLPLVFHSIETELFSRQDTVLYNGLTGVELPQTPPQVTAKSDTFVTVGVLDVDQVNSMVTLAVSGNRFCQTRACSTLDLHFYALDNNVTQRRGVPPVQTLTLKPEDVMFSQSLTLPIRGTPNMYPFDTYQLWLGVSGTVTEQGQPPREMNLEGFQAGVEVALQNLDNTLIMAQPVPIPADSVHSPTDPYNFLAVQSLSFREPTYLVVLAVMLVLMISVSSGIAMTTKNYQDLVLGVGGIVLSVWGVRSILAVSSARGVTLLDLSLSVVILLLLLTFVVRSALFFHQHSDLPPVREIRPLKPIGRLRK